MRKNILKIVFMVWVMLWAVFFMRELFVKNNIRDYAALFSRTLEGKHAYVTGDALYGFLQTCKEKLPAGATYRIVGIDESSIERRRAVYYLYPCVESADPDFFIDASQFTVRKAKE